MPQGEIGNLVVSGGMFAGYWLADIEQFAETTRTVSALVDEHVVV